MVIQRSAVMETVPFTKAEVQTELSAALLLFVRSTSWVMDREAAYRLMGWPTESAGDALCNPSFTEFAEVAEHEGQTLDLSRFNVVQTFDALYDYGVLGILQSPIFPIENATDATFAISFVFDCARSELLFEMQGGASPVLKHCIHTARVAIARQVLDGGERCLIQSGDKPDKLLTIPEVALLANMEERSVRNSASGKPRPDLLKTVVQGGDRFVTPEDALAWLSARRGFNKTQMRGHLADLDLRTRAFQGSWEIADFVRQRAGAKGASLSELADRVGLPASTESLESQLRDLGLLCDPEISRRLAVHLGLDENLLALRLNECRIAEQLAGLRKSIDNLRERSSS
jgi:hypothetical protein